MRKGDPRGTAEWQRRRAHLIKEARAHGTICELCDNPILFDAPARSRWSPSIDHVLPIATYGEQAASAGPLRVVHYGCNARRGARDRAPMPTPRPTRTVTSGVW